jgi:thioredoxin reductase (NADPH)
MYDLIIIGAGPGGIALAAEACAAGVDVSKILVLEKAHTHNWAIRQLYPEQKITTANYKGFAAKCEGLLCLEDMTKTQTIEYFDKVIKDYKINTKYDSDVYGMQRLNNDDGMRFRVQSSNGTFESRVLGVAIGIFGRPNKPQDYLFPPSLRQRLLFDITSVGDLTSDCAAWLCIGSQKFRPRKWADCSRPRYSKTFSINLESHQRELVDCSSPY